MAGLLPHAEEFLPCGRGGAMSESFEQLGKILFYFFYLASAVEHDKPLPHDMVVLLKYTPFPQVIHNKQEEVDGLHVKGRFSK
jgi:hypothetical protein